MQVPNLPLLETLRVVEFALNKVPRTSLRGAPYPVKDTYELVKLVEAHLYFRSKEGER